VRLTGERAAYGDGAGEAHDTLGIPSIDTRADELLLAVRVTVALRELGQVMIELGARGTRIATTSDERERERDEGREPWSHGPS